jgi:hypothetical protein
VTVTPSTSRIPNNVLSTFLIDEVLAQDINSYNLHNAHYHNILHLDQTSKNTHNQFIKDTLVVHSNISQIVNTSFNFDTIYSRIAGPYEYFRYTSLDRDTLISRTDEHEDIIYSLSGHETAHLRLSDRDIVLSELDHLALVPKINDTVIVHGIVTPDAVLHRNNPERFAYSSIINTEISYNRIIFDYITIYDHISSDLLYLKPAKISTADKRDYAFNSIINTEIVNLRNNIINYFIDDHISNELLYDRISIPHHLIIENINTESVHSYINNDFLLSQSCHVDMINRAIFEDNKFESSNLVCDIILSLKKQFSNELAIRQSNVFLDTVTSKIANLAINIGNISKAVFSRPMADRFVHGEHTHETFVIIPTPLISINNQSENQDITLLYNTPLSAQLFVEASVTLEQALSYQWQKKNNENIYVDIIGANTNTLDVGPLTLSDNGSVYRARIDATGGATSIYSNSITISVHPVTPTPTPTITPTVTPTPSFTPTPFRISAPDAPTNLVAYGADGQIIMYWSPPLYDGRRDITDHIVEYTPLPSATATHTPTPTQTPSFTPSNTPTPDQHSHP